MEPVQNKYFEMFRRGGGGEELQRERYIDRYIERGTERGREKEESEREKER